MNEVPRRSFATKAEFLAAAQRLIAQERVEWSKRAAIGHTISKPEAETVVWWARPQEVDDDMREPARYVVWGLVRGGKRARVLAWINAGPRGDYLSLRAHDEDRDFGS